MCVFVFTPNANLCSDNISDVATLSLKLMTFVHYIIVYGYIVYRNRHGTCNVVCIIVPVFRYTMYPYTIMYIYMY